MFVDQTTSELELHKIQYLIKFLRGLMLSLITWSAIVFICQITGTPEKNLPYFISDNAETSSGFLFPAIGGIMVFWLYHSIINLHRKTLRIIAIIMVFAALTSGCYTIVAQLLALNSSISLLCALSVYLIIKTTITIFVAIDIWKTSNRQDNIAFQATLDERLAPTIWVDFNKLFDLPRTPLRNWRTVLAYLISLVGTLILITSLLEILSAGNILARVDSFNQECATPVKTPRLDCETQPQTIMNQVAITLLVAVFGFAGGGYLQAFSKKIRNPSADEILQRNPRFTLYLRAFGADDVILPKPHLPFLSRIFYFQPFPVHLEQELFDVTDGYRPLIALGNPRNTRSLGGVSYRDYVDDDHWQDYVASKIEEAENIVVVLRETQNVYWEASKIATSNAIEKTLFLFDPIARDDRVWDSISEAVLPLLQRNGPQTAIQFKGRSLGFFFSRGEFVEIMNSNWTATSYRTAFSWFLVEKLYERYRLQSAMTSAASPA